MLAASYKTKKDLKASIGQALKYTETFMFGQEYKPDGRFCVVGPGAYQRKWFAEVEMKQGLIYKVR